MAEKLALAAAVYSWYAALMGVDRGELGGRLLLVMDGDGVEALVRAANIAGTGTLLLVAQAAQAQQRVRSGVCDFMVTALDEALRILKNELRRGQAVSVCLLGDPDQVLQECVARGVQPDLVLRSLGVLLKTFEERGSRVISPLLDAPSLAASLVLWTVEAGSSRMFPMLDSLAAYSLSPGEQQLSQRWLRRAPQYLGRGLARHRTLPMDDAEAQRFAEAVEAAIRDQRLTAEVRVFRGGYVLVGDADYSCATE